ncbi:MAG TPA: hypothetical protein VFO48_07915 [Vicinamibacterales bacterium]|nr:hypothetical protein [Vicinamibacterales bacterium]
MKSGQTTAEELLRVVTEVREMRALRPGAARRSASTFSRARSAAGA